MAAGRPFIQSASTSPPQQFPSTSSVAPPVHNSASVTFAPDPTTVTRSRAYSTSASGLTSPTSPALESMAAINIEAMRKSPSSSASSSASPPSAPLASHHALVNATGSPPPGSASHGKSVSAGYEVAGAGTLSSSSDPSAISASINSNGRSDSAIPLSPPFTSSAASRRHSVDPYSQCNNSNHHLLDKSINTTTPLQGAAGHRRHHQSISVPPSSSEYSSLGELRNSQANHLHQLNSRYRKSSLGSQALLSPTAVDHMTSPPTSTGLSGSSSRLQQWDQHAHRSHHTHNDPTSGPQLSPTRSRNDPYLSPSSRYSSRASHEAQRNNQLEAKIVLLGRQGEAHSIRLVLNLIINTMLTLLYSCTLSVMLQASAKL